MHKSHTERGLEEVNSMFDRRKVVVAKVGEERINLKLVSLDAFREVGVVENGKEIFARGSVEASNSTLKNS